MTALPGLITAFGVSDCAITPMLTDSSSGATYGTTYDVPGIQSVGLAPVLLSKTLKGPDGLIIDVYGKTTNVNGAVSHGRISLAVLQALMSSTLNTAGTTPNRTATLAMNQSDLTGFFKLECQVLYNSQQVGGDTHVLFYKCKISKFKVEFKNEDYAQVSFDFIGIPRIYDGKLVDLVENETLVNLVPGTPSTTAPSVSSSTPINGATAVSDSLSSVVLTFNESLMASSVSLATFLVQAEVAGTQVATAVSLSTTTNTNDTVTITLGTLAAATLYNVVATQGVQSVAGVPMAANYWAKFTTT